MEIPGQAGNDSSCEFGFSIILTRFFAGFVLKNLCKIFLDESGASSIKWNFHYFVYSVVWIEV